MLACWIYNTEGGFISPKLPRSGLGKWESPECRIDVELFLDEYPRWELRAPHWSVILHEMFLDAAEWGHKEVEDSSTGDAEAVHPIPT